MGDKEDYLTSYREFFENFAATVNPEDQLPVNIAGYTITEAELPGEVLYWTTQYLAEKQCPSTLMTPLRRIILDEVLVASKKHPNEFGYKSDESVYIALRLMQAVTARVNDVCLRYLDNSRLDSLPPPPPLNLRELKTVSIATKNSRRVMEDRHVEIGNLDALFGIETTEPTSFYAVYDGHAGSAAATYCAAHLHQYVVESPHFSTDLRRAMRDAFLRTDAEVVRKSNQDRACGGSTAVAVAVRGRKLLAAWAGDSLALLAKRMRLMQLVRPHKPGRQDERDRIESSGGTVMYWGTWRVNGQLAVSRAIGDAQYKPYVTARPETATVELDGDEDFVVVACDGLWDFVSEDDVALAVYRQVATDPDDLKAVTKRLVVQAKRQGSADNISIIVVFLKDPRDIAADNCPPMDLGLDNALANVPPFVMETEACKRADGAAAAEAEAEAEADNGVDHSDSDSEDLGPETAVDVDADLDDLDAERHNPQPPTPPAHAVETNHVDGGLVDNVAESGEESEDEWNYFKGEGERRDEPRSDTPCQDNSAWETSSVDMNTSPLNPDAPPFVPGTVSDVVLAESPRKPVPMDDIELPDVAEFRTEATGRPAELLDLDNCDQLNGHHNVSINEASKEHSNGNEKCELDSLGFGFGAESGKGDTSLIHDFDRIQKDTTDFCNIQVFPAHTETNPFSTGEGNEELFERLKNKERDPMSMSFYQEKDDDTCDRVDLNAVRTLPDSEDDEPTNGLADDKENVSPHTADLLGTFEPNNDIDVFPNIDSLRQNVVNRAFEEFGHHTTTNIFPNMDFGANEVQEVAHTDTPESHKLLFEQIPEIPDGKSSELGFNDDNLDLSEIKDGDITPQVETSWMDMDSKPDDSPLEETEPKLSPEPEIENVLEHQAQVNDAQNEIISECEMERVDETPAPEEPIEEAPPAPLVDAVTPEHAHDVQQNIVVDVHQDSQPHDDFQVDNKFHMDERIHGDVVEIEEDVEAPENLFAASPMPAQSPLPAHSPLPSKSPAPCDDVVMPMSPVPAASPAPAPLMESLEAAPSSLPAESLFPAQSPLPAQSPFHAPSPLPAQSPVPAQSPLPVEPQELAPSPLPVEEPIAASPAPAEVPLPHESPLPSQEPALRPESASPAPSTPSPRPPAELAARLSPPPAEPSGPAPDLVPGPLESRAQEICVPVTRELPHETFELASPPPTPAADSAPLTDTPIAADAAPPAEVSADAATVAAAAVAAAAVAATAAAVAKTKTPSSATKKAPTTPKAGTPAKPAPKMSTAARTPLSAKKPVSGSTTAKSPAATKSAPARTPLSASKPTPKAPAAAAAPKTAPIARAAPAKPTTAATKPAAPKPAPPRSALAPKPAAAKPAAVKESTISAKSAPQTRTVPAARPAPRPAPARPATAVAAARPAAPAAPRPASARPAPRPAPARPADKKPLTNGDVRPAARPAPAAAAPRPTPRAAAPAAPTKSAAPKPAPRASQPARDADKQSKDLANRRITAKAAPPRTAAAAAAAKKAPASTKPVPIRGPIKRPVVEAKPEPAANGLPNGAPADSPVKSPPSPPPTDNALLPDVIA